ncbi:MAG: HAMP domain-containing histidine kinase [Pseudazoarcus pumilus]|nr:HAMP domain-containing histidine kinase [Pseudazoarcus pumilus]
MLHPQVLLHDAASQAQRDALLALLGETPPDFPAATRCFADDPVLLHALLRAMPLDRECLDRQLFDAVETRLNAVGADLLTAWLLSRSGRPHNSRTDLALRRQSQHAADIARALSQAAGHRFADDAALVALWSRLAQLLRVGPLPGGGHQAPSRQLNARLAEECGCSPLICDALMLADAAEEQVLQAHPLSAISWCANRLAANAEHWLQACARVSGLSVDTLMHVVAVQPAAELPVPDDAGESDPNLPAPLSATSPRLLEAALAGFALKAFAGLDGTELRVRYEAAARLLCDQHPLLVIVAQEDRLHALSLTDQPAVTRYHNESAQPLDDEASVLALAVRSQTPTSWHRDDDGPGRSVRDWQLARWIGRSGFVCIPFSAGATRGAIVVAPEHSPLPATEVARLLVSLTSAAAAVAIERHAREALARELRQQVEQRHREHARRIAHEARNPLSVIRSYLHLIPQRHAGVAGLSDDLRIVQDEIERLGGLIDTVGQAPEPAAEPAHCDVVMLLRDMQAMLGESLFGSRGIQLELRTQPDLPQAAMPASALRQVMLNLLHNAADILHPGGRCTVALAGELIADGARCIEIRVIDNGPGLPPERLDDLFSPQPSRKGGQHQGLGLSITRDILERWQARILCRSQNGVGTSFQLLVPIISE